MVEKDQMKLRREGLYEQIANALENRILTDDTFSRKLPPEIELSSTLGVSRTVLREALKLLKERGLITM
ncbi:MAG: GntR family transcriptional regulator, partial [Sphaerochaetaceae bacterium]